MGQTRGEDARQGGVREQLVGRLGGELRNVVDAAGERLVARATERISTTTERLAGYARDGSPGARATATGVQQLAEGKSPLRAGLRAGLVAGKEKLKAKLGRGGAKGKVKVTNIVESVDVGVPVRVAYNQWTRLEDFPRFMKKVEHVERESPAKLTWKAQVFWSHRTWESTVVEQVPDERIVWRSTGDKGSVDGTVTFHEVAPNLTRILLVLEYHPQGLFEKTGNIWRAQGRRVRLELKHFARHVMTQAILRPDEIEGWRGEIRDGQVVRDHAPDPDPTPAPKTRRAKGGAGDLPPADDDNRPPRSGPRRTRAKTDARTATAGKG